MIDYTYDASAENNPFRFSTKFWNAEIGLYDYGYRHYAPALGLWVGRASLVADQDPATLSFRNNPVQSATVDERMSTVVQSDVHPRAVHGPGGLSVCDLETGKHVIVDVREACVGDCAFRHETIHVIQLTPACEALKKGCDKYPYLCQLFTRLYNQWMDDWKSSYECPAYIDTLACYMGLSKEARGKSTKCCEEIDEVMVAAGLGKTLYCTPMPPPLPPPPHFP